jgi:hypothetical protein
MKIKYHINLGNYVTKENFNSAYHNEVILNDKFEIISNKVELMGYFPYKLFDDEDNKRVKEKYKKELKEIMDDMIYKIDEQVTIAVDILRENKNIETIKLNPYNEGEFTMYVSIENIQ